MVTSAEAGGATVSNGAAAAAFAAGVATAAASTATSSSKATRPSSTTSVGFSHRVVVEPVHGGSTSGYRTHCPWPTTTTDFQRQTDFKLDQLLKKKKKKETSLFLRSPAKPNPKQFFFQRQLFSSPPSLTFIVSSVSTVPTVRTTSEHQSSLSSPSTPPTKHTGAKKAQPGGWLSGWMGEVPPTRCVDSGALKVCLARAGATIALCSGRS